MQDAQMDTSKLLYTFNSSYRGCTENVHKKMNNPQHTCIKRWLQSYNRGALFFPLRISEDHSEVRQTLDIRVDSTKTNIFLTKLKKTVEILLSWRSCRNNKILKKKTFIALSSELRETIKIQLNRRSESESKFSYTIWPKQS